MSANLTSLTPNPANPGDAITLIGTGFVAGAVVTFAGGSASYTDQNAVVVSATEITTTAPDFGGDAIALQVTVTGTDNVASGALALQLRAWPPVDAIYPLCGLAALKRFLGLGVDDNDADDQLRDLILTASAQMARIVTYDLQPVVITNERYDGDDTARLDLRRLPVNSVTAMSIDGQPVDVSTVLVYDDYIAFDDGNGAYNPRLRASGQIFAAGRQNVVVSYTAGFTSVPADLARACMLQVSFLKNTLGRQGLLSDSNSITNSTTQYAQLPVAPMARIAANRYRRGGMKAI